MVKGPLAYRLEYGILEIIMSHKDGTHQASWGEWLNSVGKLVPDLVHDADLKAAFKRLWKGGIVRLSKAAEGRYHGFDYSGNEGADEAFFFITEFNVTITADGGRFWDFIKTESDPRYIP
jgi:hypothetical protein